MKIWFTKGLSNTADAIRLLRSAYNANISIMASHTDPIASAGRYRDADEFIMEPPTRAGYAQWALGVAREADVDMIIVQRGLEELWAARDEFAQAGIRLHFTASPATARLLDRKDLFGIELEKLGIPTPGYETFRTLEEFDEGAAVLEAGRDLRDGLCIKPVTGIFGSGFRHLRHDVPEADLILGNRFYEYGRDNFRDLLAKSPFGQDMMLMEFMPGPERSVDFIARDGQFMGGVSRIKEGAFQTLEAYGTAIELAEALTNHFGLNGICNMQTREDEEGNQHVLEINPRMSGGMQIACMSGLNLPAWDVALAMGLRPAGDMPRPRHGVRVAIQEVPVLID